MTTLNTPSQPLDAHISICRNPVFIIGAPRSGTTILAWSLAQHSKLWTSGESYILFDFFGEGRADSVFEKARDLSEGSWLDAQKVTRSEFRCAVGLGFNALFSSRSEGKRWVDQTPHYALIADMLAEIYPEAQFLHILRDGRDVVRSMQSFLNLFKDDPKRKEMIESGALAPWATNFREACMTWRDYVQSALRFTTSTPERCLTVHNEELQKNPNSAFSRILAFLGLPYEDGPAEYCRSNRMNSSFTGALTKNTTDAPFLPPWEAWTAEQRQTFFEEAGSTLTCCGFAKPNDLALSDYDRTVIEIRMTTAVVLPLDCNVLVASKGDPQLLDLGGRKARHFPESDTGEYAGHHPTDSADAIAQLERARSKGMEYLIIPATAFWWLEHYDAFRVHLENHALLLNKTDWCAIYDMRERTRTAEPQDSGIGCVQVTPTADAPASIPDVPVVTAVAESLAAQWNAAEGRKRQLLARLAQPLLPPIYSHDGTRLLGRSVLELDPPWKASTLRECGIPGMISEEEKQYYVYLGAYYQGHGRVLELGPWLGLSTAYIIEGLHSNPRFAGEKLHVFDDFIWRSSWMDPVYARFGAPDSEMPTNHASFRPLFAAYAKDFSQHLIVYEQRISTFSENAHLPPLSWDGDPIEICYVDCGRTIEANQAWYRALRPFFIPDRTLIVMQDWQVHKEVPVRWFNQTKQFTDSEGPALDLLHELCHGGIATFLYRG